MFKLLGCVQEWKCRLSAGDQEKLNKMVASVRTWLEKFRKKVLVRFLDDPFL